MFQFLSGRPWIRLVFLVVKLMRLIELVFRDIYFILELPIKGTVVVIFQLKGGRVCLIHNKPLNIHPINDLKHCRFNFSHLPLVSEALNPQITYIEKQKLKITDF